MGYGDNHTASWGYSSDDASGSDGSLPIRNDPAGMSHQEGSSVVAVQSPSMRSSTGRVTRAPLLEPFTDRLSPLEQERVVALPDAPFEGVYTVADGRRPFSGRW